jgi:HlyD family secretion protein
MAVTLIIVGRSAPSPPAVATTTVSRGTVTLQVSASGTVQAASTRGLSFSMAGTVTEVDVKAGDAVKAGQVLARIDPTNAQATVTSDEQRVSDASDAVTRAEQTLALPACPSATPRPSGGTGGGPGGGGGTGGPPLTPHPSSSPSAVASSSATIQSASLIVAAPTGGAGSGGAQPSATCTQAGRQQSTTDALLSAQQQLNNANLALLEAQAKLTGTTITAPLAGRVLSVAGKVGSAASPGGTGFIVLGDISTFAVTAQFSEADVGRLAIGQPASITLPDQDQPLPGSVSTIDPAGTISSRLVRYGVVIAFQKPPADLLLGQSADVTVTTASAANVLYASSAAVTGVANGTGTVTVRTPTGNQARTVKIGLRGDQYTEIDSGVNPGDVLILPTG